MFKGKSREGKMRKPVMLIITFLFFTFAMVADDAVITEVKAEELNLGSIKFPRAFIHNGKDYNKGIYKVTIKEKEGEFLFSVFNPSDELLFEEVAIVKIRKSRIGKRKFLLRQSFMKGYEFFRIKVTMQDKVLMGYFLLTKNKPAVN